MKQQWEIEEELNRPKIREVRRVLDHRLDLERCSKFYKIDLDN